MTAQAARAASALPVLVIGRRGRRQRGDAHLLRGFQMGTRLLDAVERAFKRITAGCSQIEKLAPYSGTAKRLYHLD